MKIIKHLRMVFAASLLLTVANAHAGLIGYLSQAGAAGNARMATAIALNGDTGQVIGDLANDDLSIFDAVWIIDNSNSGGFGALSAGLANLNSYVTNGGGLFLNDRTVGNNTTTAGYLAGLGAGSLVQVSVSAWSDTSVTAPGGSLLTNGPNGTIDDTTIDNGTSSFHGAITKTSIISLGGTALIERESNGETVGVFYYGLGAGTVLYGRNPMDYHLTGNAPLAYRDIFAPNGLALIQSLTGATPAPEPTTLALLGLALLGMRGQRRAKA